MTRALFLLTGLLLAVPASADWEVVVPEPDEMTDRPFPFVWSSSVLSTKQSRPGFPYQDVRSGASAV